MKTQVMLINGLRMSIEFLPEAKGNHRSTVSFEMWDAGIGQSEEIPLFETDDPEE